MSNLYAPFRYDYVGSFLRPAELKKARADYEAGAITADQLKAVEDQCITELVAKQKAAGYHVITDGEFRRATWHLDFMWGFDGVGHKKTNTGLPFHGEAAMIDDTFVTGRIGLSGEHPFVDHFRYVKALEDEKTIAKQTIPAPAQTLAQFWMPFARKHTEAFYSSAKPLMTTLHRLTLLYCISCTMQAAGMCSLTIAHGECWRIKMDRKCTPQRKKGFWPSRMPIKILTTR